MSFRPEKRFVALFIAFAISATVTSTPSRGNERYAKNKAKASQYTVDDNPNPRGSGLIAGGIVTASVGGGVGLLILFLSLFSYCGYDETEDKECVREKKNQEYLGGGVAVVSIAVGVPLIVMGAKERSIWKQWNRENVKGYSLAPGEVLRASNHPQSAPVKTQYLVYRDAQRLVRPGKFAAKPLNWPIVQYNF